MFQLLLGFLLLAGACACGTTQYTTTIAAEVTDMVISAASGVQLSVSIDANEDNLQALVSFHGNSLASSVVGTSTDGTTFIMNIQASDPTEPPSSANSMIFFSGASKTVADLTLALSLSATAWAQCPDQATVTLSVPSAWEIVSESASSVSLRYNPRQWGFELTATMSNRTLEDWTAADEAALFDAIASTLGSGYSYEVLLTVMSDGGLSVTVLVSGYTSEADAVTGSQSILDLSLDATTVTTEAPSFACLVGLSATSDGLCVDTDGCQTNSCDAQITGNTCVDVPAPGVKYTCNCHNDGLFDNQALVRPACQDVDGCIDNTCGHGDCVDAIQPETGYSCNCSVGYSDANGTCVDTAGCDGYAGSCMDGGDIAGNCTDIAAPGTGYTCICSAGYNIDSSSCVLQDCGTPNVPTGYSLDSGATSYGTSRVLTCAAGYAGSPSPLVCNANDSQAAGSRGVWTSISGCAIQSCPSSPTQTGYTFGAGASTYGSTRSASCATGYTGTASQITCQNTLSWTASSGCTIRNCGTPSAVTGYVFASGSTTYGSSLTSSCATGYEGSGTSITCSSSATWSSPSGCTIVSCPSSPTQTGYTVASGASTYGSSRTVTCATGYTGTASSITCQASAAWTVSSGCTIRNCGTPVASAGYVLGSGSTTFGSTYSMSCATGYTGTAAALTCQADGTWTAQSGCTIRNCGTPVASTGYALGSGSTTYNSSFSMSCASGYTGTAATLTCRADGTWSAQSGCTIVNCGTPSVSSAYNLGSGSTTYGSTYSLSCNSSAGYSGTASSITCQANGTWSAPSGCSAGSCGQIKASTGTNTDGVYSITMSGTSPANHYCIMNNAVNGGGWMLVMKAAASGGTFAYTSSHWTSVTTLNAGDTNRNAGDAKYSGFDYFLATDVMAIFPDLDGAFYSFYEHGFNRYNGRNGAAISLSTFFAATQGSGGYRISPGKSFSGWRSGYFSSQGGFQWYGFNYNTAAGGGKNVRWGFGWNNEGEEYSNDLTNGIGLGSDAGWSAGDRIWCCPDTTGVNRQMRVEMYVRCNAGATTNDPGSSCANIKACTGTNSDGVYWLYMPSVGSVQHWCIMDSNARGGGWMLALKATRAGTFAYGASYWTSVNTLNPSTINRNDGDAKYEAFNRFRAKEIMALFPDVSGVGYDFYESNFNGYNGRSGSRIELVNFFSETNNGNYYISLGKSFSGWKNGVFSSQSVFSWYGFNYYNPWVGCHSRWGFGWNENTPGDQTSNDVYGGIGTNGGWSGCGAWSASDCISCCQDTTGVNRNMRVEIFVR